MGIFSFLSKGSHSDYHLALDIGTEVVKALVFAVDEDTDLKSWNACRCKSLREAKNNESIFEQNKKNCDTI
jgi:hypothetical protein